MKKIILASIIILGLGVLIWFFATKPSGSAPASEVISNNGLHWHATLNIKILGEAQEIPAGLGLEALPHKPLHVHDRDNVIHMEFEGRVSKDDLKLWNFFQIWGKIFNGNCIFDRCSGEEGQLKMLVNGKPNSEFENYSMKDGDKIEIIFEEKLKTTSEVKEVTVVGAEFSFSPADLTVAVGEKIKLIFKNSGSASHNLIIEGLGISTKTISGGETDIVEFTAPASGTYKFFCSIPGHRPAGMEGSLIVE